MTCSDTTYRCVIACFYAWPMPTPRTSQRSHASRADAARAARERTSRSVLPRTPEPLNSAVRRNMQANKGRDTAPELALRRELHRRGRRFRVNQRPERKIRSTADLVFAGPRVAVYVD